MDKSYQHHEREQFWSQYWVEKRIFSHISERDAKPFCVMIPPPNVTGSLHMGHAFEDTLIDIQIRYHAARGRRVLWQVGVDHAGIATQMVVDRQLEAQGVNPSDLSRDERISKIWEWKEQSGGTILSQLKRLGCGIDWSKERFTLDDEYQKSVLEAFVKLYRQGLIVKKKRLVNWDSHLQSAVSDLEVDSVEEKTSLYHLKYEVVGHPDQFLIVATTRPETLFGDMAIAVHPDDSRYQHLIGHHVRIPLSGREIPVIADPQITPEFGTGCVKITPAHDFFDFEVAQRQQIDFCNILNPDGTLNHHAQKYQGVDRLVARPQIVQELQSLGLLDQITPHVSMVPRCSRTDEVIEPYLTEQWYLSMETMAKNALNAHSRGDFVFIPEQWNTNFRQWLEQIQDWCLSRQLIWGHRIPAWYDDLGQVYVGYDEKDVRAHYHLDPQHHLYQDSDVLDTWFSAALWPFATLGWPHQDFQQSPFFPNSVLVSGFDIIFFWVARMIMFSLHFTDNAPFSRIFLHGIVQDQDGQKMSKSKGNVIDPIDLIDGISFDDLIQKRTQGLMQPEKKSAIIAATQKSYPQGFASFGVDPLRLTLSQQASPGRFIRFDIQRLQVQQQTCHKLWNLMRFVLPHLISRQNAPLKLTHPLNLWICHELTEMTKQTEQFVHDFRFDLYSQSLIDFMWTQVCDRYVEFSKVLLHTEYAEETKQTLSHVMHGLLWLLHPMIPFMTEELSFIIHQKVENQDIDQYQCIVERNLESVLLQVQEESSSQNLQDVEMFFDLLKTLRTLRAQLDLPPKEPIQLVAPAFEQHIQKFAPFYEKLAQITYCREKEPVHANLIALEQAVDGTLFTVILDKKYLLARIERINQSLLQLEKQMLPLQAKLSDQVFVDKAPAAVVSAQKERLSALEKEYHALKQSLQAIG